MFPRHADSRRYFTIFSAYRYGLAVFNTITNILLALIDIFTLSKRKQLVFDMKLFDLLIITIFIENIAILRDKIT